MFSHIAIGANDIELSKAFYDAALGALGIPPGTFDDKGRCHYATDQGRLMLTRPINGAAATGANGGTIGFTAQDTASIDAWHAAGIAHGGTTCEDSPGIRDMGKFQLYLAYMRDPAGNKLCAMHVVS
jgi:catechol 2,3-dioxygenase-like lactoylglutathione lyase family enzyme